MNKLTDLEFFLKLVRLGSLTALAREYGVAASTVSKRLAAIEARLGVRLLNRSTRRMHLTVEGEHYFSQGGRLAADLRELEQTLAGARAVPRGLLRVSATMGFGREHIAPAVSEFCDSYPEVEVALYLSDRPMSQDMQDFDVAIRIGELPDASLAARRIALNERILCASPAYLGRHGSPARPYDLLSHRCLIIRENDETHGVWKLTAETRTETVKVRGRLSSNDGLAVLSWALDGQGIALRSRWNVAHHLRAGRLVHVLPDWASKPADIMAVFPTRQHLTAKTRAFVDFLAKRFEGATF